MHVGLATKYQLGRRPLTMQRVGEASDCITIAVADAPAPALSSSMTATATRQRRRSSVESLKSSLRRGSCDVAEFIAKRMPTRRVSVRDRRPMALDLETARCGSHAHEPTAAAALPAAGATSCITEQTVPQLSGSAAQVDWGTVFAAAGASSQEPPLKVEGGHEAMPGRRGADRMEDRTFVAQDLAKPHASNVHL